MSAHSGRGPKQVAAAIEEILDAWEEAECGCCSPSTLDDAFDHLPLDEAFGERLMRFGVEVAYAGRMVIEQEREAARQVPGSGASEPGGTALTEVNATRREGDR